MESKQPTSSEPSRVETPTDNALAENVKGKVKEPQTGKPHVEEVKRTNSDPLLVITDEVLRNRIRALIDEKPKPSKLQRISNNSLVLVLVGALLSLISGILGGYFAQYHAKQLQELAVQRSLSDELNKMRVQKIGEVWEQIDENELVLDSLLESANRASGSNKEEFDKISKLVDEDIAIINKNRYWLGEPTYNQVRDYLDITGQYVSDMLLGRPGIDLSETLKKREQSKKNVLHMRSMFLEGEPEPGK